MAIHDRRVTGNPSTVYETLKQFVGNQAGKASNYKIGITNDPQRRFDQAYQDEYDDMFVFYETKSIENARTLERWMIEEHWAVSDNQVGGGGGRVGDPPYFVYLVVKKAVFQGAGGAIGGAIFGGSIGGPIGAIIGGFVGAIISDAINKNK